MEFLENRLLLLVAKKPEPYVDQGLRALTV